MQEAISGLFWVAWGMDACCAEQTSVLGPIAASATLPLCQAHLTFGGMCNVAGEHSPGYFRVGHRLCGPHERGPRRSP